MKTPYLPYFLSLFHDLGKIVAGASVEIESELKNILDGRLSVLEVPSDYMIAHRHAYYSGYFFLNNVSELPEDVRAVGGLVLDFLLVHDLDSTEYKVAKDKLDPKFLARLGVQIEEQDSALLKIYLETFQRVKQIVEGSGARSRGVRDYYYSPSDLPLSTQGVSEIDDLGLFKEVYGELCEWIKGNAESSLEEYMRSHSDMSILSKVAASRYHAPGFDLGTQVRLVSAIFTTLLASGNPQDDCHHAFNLLALVNKSQSDVITPFLGLLESEFALLREFNAVTLGTSAAIVAVPTGTRFKDLVTLLNDTRVALCSENGKRDASIKQLMAYYFIWPSLDSQAGDLESASDSWLFTNQRVNFTLLQVLKKSAFGLAANLGKIVDESCQHSASEKVATISVKFDRSSKPMIAVDLSQIVKKIESCKEYDWQAVVGYLIRLASTTLGVGQTALLDNFMLCQIDKHSEVKKMVGDYGLHSRRLFTDPMNLEMFRSSSLLRRSI